MKVSWERKFPGCFKSFSKKFQKKFHVAWHSSQLPEQKEGLFVRDGGVDDAVDVDVYVEEDVSEANILVSKTSKPFAVAKILGARRAMKL